MRILKLFWLQRKVRRLLWKSSNKNTQKVNCKTNICIDQKNSKVVFSMKNIELVIWLELKIKCTSRFHTLNSWDVFGGFSNHLELHHNSYLLVNHQESRVYEPYLIGNENLQFFWWILRESVRYMVCVDRKGERMRKNQNIRALILSIW